MTTANHPIFLKVVSHIIEYVRWTQITPMLAAWASLILFSTFFFLTIFLEQSHSIVESIIALWSEHPWLNNYLEITEEGNITLDENDIKHLATSVWPIIAFILYLVSTVKKALCGSAPALPFKTICNRLSATLAIIWCGLSVAYALNHNTLEGEWWIWILFFTLGCLTVFFISLYSLAISFLLGRVRLIE